MTERTEEEVEWLNRIRTMEKLDRELFTRKETFYAIKYESEKEIRDISKMVKDSCTTINCLQRKSRVLIKSSAPLKDIKLLVAPFP